MIPSKLQEPTFKHIYFDFYNLYIYITTCRYLRLERKHFAYLVLLLEELNKQYTIFAMYLEQTLFQNAPKLFKVKAPHIFLARNGSVYEFSSLENLTSY